MVSQKYIGRLDTDKTSLMVNTSKSNVHMYAYVLYAMCPDTDMPQHLIDKEG